MDTSSSPAGTAEPAVVEVKPESFLYFEVPFQAPKKDWSENLNWLDAEYPELIPDAIEKANSSLCSYQFLGGVPQVAKTWKTGSRDWAGSLQSNYLSILQDFWNKEKLAVPPVEATDELLWELVGQTYDRRYEEAKVAYQSDIVYQPDIAHLRELWEYANQEAAIGCVYSRRDRVDNCRSYFRQSVEKELGELAIQIRHASPEYQAELEALRIKQEKLEAEQAVKLKFWEDNQRRRRQQDMEIADLGKLNIHVLCYEGEDYAHEFYGQFFSADYMGEGATYWPNWKGYRLPKWTGLGDLLFSVSGTIFDHSTEEKEKIEGSNFILIYGWLVCGYPINRYNRFSPNDYRRAVHGYATWLGREKSKKEGTLLEPGTYAYWTELFTRVTLAMFEKRDEDAFHDAPRNIYRSVVVRYGEKECLKFQELVDEKVFKAFLYACCEGEEHHERSSHYFSVLNVGRKKKEQLQITFNPECIPSEEMSEEEEVELLRPMFEAFQNNFGKLGSAEPTENAENISADS